MMPPTVARSRFGRDQPAAIAVSPPAGGSRSASVMPASTVTVRSSAAWSNTWFSAASESAMPGLFRGGPYVRIVPPPRDRRPAYARRPRQGQRRGTGASAGVTVSIVGAMGIMGPMGLTGLRSAQRTTPCLSGGGTRSSTEAGLIMPCLLAQAAAASCRDSSAPPDRMPAARGASPAGRRGEEPLHQGELLYAHAVLGGDAAAAGDAFFQHFVAGRLHPGGKVLIAGIKEQDRMHVAVAGMGHVDDPHAGTSRRSRRCA